MKSVLFLKNAETEFYEAIKFYNQERPGLGYEFAVQIDIAVRHIINFPDAWPILSGNTRKCVISRFPFCILYLIENTKIIIVAVMHMKRRPGYWKTRTE